jgi:hypothetical protein
MKPLFLKIAKLCKTDQRWIIQQLSPSQKKQWERLQGNTWLKEAQPFSKLPLPPHHPTEDIKLPTYCQNLQQQPNLFIAIILNQGKWPWQPRFLANHPKKDLLLQHLKDGVREIKPATQKMCFAAWQLGENP